jgi:hypothetical protein
MSTPIFKKVNTAKPIGETIPKSFKTVLGTAERKEMQLPEGTSIVNQNNDIVDPATIIHEEIVLGGVIDSYDAMVALEGMQHDTEVYDEYAKAWGLGDYEDYDN